MHVEGFIAESRSLTTAALAAASGYSPQQVRDLERLGVIPPASRAANNYRRFTGEHLVALRAYRRLATATGPVVARRTLRDALTLPLDEAAALVSALHVDLAHLRTQTLDAMAALRTIRAESGPGAEETPGDAMSIGELADALGVRASTLRFWEREGLVLPERVTSYGARRYPGRAIREARISAALRGAGYGIPAVRETLTTVRTLGDVDGPVAALDRRLTDIARRTVALIAAGADIAALLGDGAR